MPATPNKRATVREVAADAGVSIATVSAVMNGAAWVPPDTRHRVTESIRRLDYRPNRMARNLKLQHSATVGVVVSDVTNPFFTEVFRSFGHAVRGSDLSLMLVDSDQNYEIGEANFRTLVDMRVDGILLMGDSVSETTVTAFVHREPHTPVVAVERDYARAGVVRLLIDSGRAGYEATMHLAYGGRRRIGMIRGPSTGPGSTDYGSVRRFEGYLESLNAAGLPYLSERVAEGEPTFEGGAAAMRRLLEGPEPPDAVFAHNDLMALGAMQVLREHGLGVPDDVAVVGFDDIPMAGMVSPSLSTMAMPTADLGRAAAAIFTNPSGRTGGDVSLFSARLVVRSSSTVYR